MVIWRIVNISWSEGLLRHDSFLISSLHALRGHWKPYTNMLCPRKEMNAQRASSLSSRLQPVTSLVCSVQLFPILLTPSCQNWTRIRDLQLLKLPRSLAWKVFWLRHLRSWKTLIIHSVFWQLDLVNCRSVEGSRCKDHHDWYTDCTSVVHLWWSQSMASTTTSSPTRNARVPQEKACP